jgi:hypothetical protein
MMVARHIDSRLRLQPILVKLRVEKLVVLLRSVIHHAHVQRGFALAHDLLLLSDANLP